MKKILGLIFLLISVLSVSAQYIADTNVMTDTLYPGLNRTARRYLPNTPGNTIHRRFEVEVSKDSSFVLWGWYNIIYPKYSQGRSDTDAQSFACFDSSGRLLRVDSVSYSMLSGKPLIPTNTNQLTNGAGFLTSYTETDPTVPSYVKSITDTNISNWNAAYGWGDHSVQGYLKYSDTSVIATKFYVNDNFVSLTGLYSNPPWLNTLDYSKLINVPSSFTPSAHTHPINQVIGLEDSLGVKMYYSDTVSLSDRINLKLNVNDTAGKWQAQGIYLNPLDTVSLSDRINQKLSLDDTMSLSTRIDTKLSVEVDGSTTNELQTLSISNRVISISSGNSVTVPQTNWDSISGKPTFATVAISGNYNDLISKPTIPSAQVNSDWNSVSGISQILNKPTLAAVAVSGSYNDLSNKPSIVGDSIEVYKLDGSKVYRKIKIISDTIPVTGSSNGFSINISALGLTEVLSVNAVAMRNTSSATTSPNVSIRSVSTNSIVVNIIEDNPATVTILGINVLSGAPSVFASVTGLKLHVQIIGY